jgi:methyl-accepting chemotaxis protein
MNEAGIIAVLVIVVTIGAVAIVMTALAVLGLRPRLLEFAEEAGITLKVLQRTLFHVEELLREVRDKGLVDRIGTALAGLELALGKAETAVGRIDPLADDLKRTMTEARELMDDATQTSQSVRARVDDLAAMQAELTALASALTDVAADVRNKELAEKLGNVLSDTSLLAADIGILTENANSYLEHGRPLVGNIAGVVKNARERAGGISATLGALHHGAPPDDKVGKPG